MRAGALRRAANAGRGRRPTATGSARELLELGATHAHTRTIADDPVPPRVPGGHPPQRQDLPREARRLGGEEAAVDERARSPAAAGSWAARSSGSLIARGDAVRSLARGDYPGAPRPRRRAGPGRRRRSGDGRCAPSEGCDVVFHVAAKAGIWGPDADYHRSNVDGDAERDRRLPGARSARGWSTPARPASSSTAATWKGSTSRSPIPAHFEAAYPRPRPRPSSSSWRPTTPTWRRSRSGRT